MKKYLSVICGVLLVGILAISFTSCSKEDKVEPQIKTLKFNISVKTPDTKAVKTAWENNDKIFVFFNVTAGATAGYLDAMKYVTLTYNANSGKWEGAASASLIDANDLGTAGTMYGVFFPYGSVSITSDNNGGVTFKTNGSALDGQPIYTHYMSGNTPYTVETKGSIATLEGNFTLAIPDNFVYFFVNKVDKGGGVYDYNEDCKYRLNATGIIPTACTGYNAGTFSETALPVGSSMWGYTYNDAGIAFSGKIDDSWATDRDHCFMMYSGDDLTPLCKTFNKTLTSHKSIRLNMSEGWTKRGFRGYEVSPGILMRNGDGSYALTDGSNPFELWDYYNNAASLNKYYFQWNFLRDELGASGNGINPNSTKLPSGWILPSSNSTSSNYYAILFMGPTVPIKIEKPNGTISTIATNATDKAHCYVLIEKNSKTYFGAILFRDGSFIPKDANINYWGNNSQINEITYEQYLVLKAAGCVFLSCTGSVSSSGSWSSYINFKENLECYYLSCSTWGSGGSERGAAIRFLKSQSKMEAYYALGGNVNKEYYYPVRLVKTIE